MKKIILISFSLLLIGNLFAQKLSGGLFVGPSMSWMSTDSKIVKTDGMKFGYNFGALVDFNLIDNFAISTGIQFNNLGGNLIYPYGAPPIQPKEGNKTDTLAAEGKMKYNLNYIAIPVGFKGKTNEIGYITYFLKGGVTPLINIKTLASFQNNENILFENTLLKEINFFNLGWHLGGGIEYSLSGNTRILAEIIYTGGLLDVDKTPLFNSNAQNSTNNPRVALNDIHLKIGILF